MSAADLDNTTWKLTAYDDGTAPRAVPAEAEVTLSFQDGAAVGRSACNRYRSMVTIGDDGTLTFGMAMATKMACSPDLMKIEQDYLQALNAVATWHLTDGNLALQDGVGQTILRFSPD